MNTQLRQVSAAGNIILKGVGQIMLQNNAWTGLFFLAGICCGSWQMGIATIIAAITGTITAKLLKFPDAEIEMGWYGFNAALVGVAFIYFFQPSLLLWIALLTGSALSSVIHHFLIKRKFPSYTFPFIVVTWIFMAIASQFPDVFQQQTGTTAAAANDYLTLFTYSFGQVIFQENWCAGLFFIIGVLISRPIAAMYAIAGIAISAIIAFGMKEPVPDIFQGLLSYNAVLCAIAFAGNKKEDFLLGLISVVLSVIIMMLMRQMNLPALTFPFVAATWLTLLIKLVWL